jgi:hypothetical protein
MKERVRFAAWAAFWCDTPRTARPEFVPLIRDHSVMLLTIPVEVPRRWSLEPALSEPAATT